MSIYIQLVLLTLVLGVIMPQKGPKRIYYIILMAALCTYVCGFRYQFLTGDLHKYYWNYFNCGSYDWFSPELWANGRNFGFQYFNKIIYTLFGEEQQALLFAIALIIHVVLAVVIYRYSPAPWMSFLTWHCMALYIFGFSAIKQALAMAFVMLAFMAATERKPFGFLIAMALAGSIHMPSLVFLPAYWLMDMRVNGKTFIFYAILGIILYIFKDQFLDFVRSFYYEDDEIFVYSGKIGSRFFMILGFALFGVLFKGFENQDFEHLFHLMVFAAILQVFSGYDNIFTRLADYYFQFSVLYLPMTFYGKGKKLQQSYLAPVFPFNKRSLTLLSLFICVFMLWFYWTFNINITIDYAVDNYLNFRFMWDVLS